MNAQQADALLASLIAEHGHGIVIQLAAAAFRADCKGNPPEDGGWDVTNIEDHRDWAHGLLECIEGELF